MSMLQVEIGAMFFWHFVTVIACAISWPES
jgi:hypothetical protein